MLGSEVAGRGQGRNKQTAEQAAARNALETRGWL
jgi:ribonuclease-3